ncbi:MAG: tetratricopeptide repeat protein [Gemmatimonadales bacterium]
MHRTATALTIAAAIALAACGEKKVATPEVSAPSVTESGATAGAPTTTTASTAATAPVSYADAETSFRHGDYAEAVGKFESYTRGNPDNAWGQYMLGLSAWKSGQHERALQAFDAALAIDPAHRKSLLNSARVLLETGQPETALERVQKSLSIEPMSSEGLRLLGRAQADLGHFNDAVDAYQRALAIDDTDVWTMNNLGYLYIQQGRADAALPPLARAVEIRGNAPVFQNNLGSALEATGHLSAARTAYESALAADSMYEKASVGLARVTARVDGTDTVSVDLSELSKQFQGEIEGWRTAVVPADSSVSDSVGTDSVPADSVTTDSSQAMVRDSVSQ